jgi:nucleoside 2-deoxyribosyltransferase
MRVFIAGVMQASLAGKGIVDQSYRNAIGEALLAKWPELDVIDPLVLHPNSVEYDDEAARETLFALVTLAASCDLVIAYVPQASMGTALEMNAAYEKGVPVIAISPLRENWVIRAMSTRVFGTLDEFVTYLAGLEKPSELIDRGGAER